LPTRHRERETTKGERVSEKETRERDEDKKERNSRMTSQQFSWKNDFDFILFKFLYW
jgi:hypothetical protein